MARAAAEIGAGALWLQSGIAHPDSRAAAEGAGADQAADRLAAIRDQDIDAAVAREVLEGPTKQTAIEGASRIRIGRQ